MLAFQLTASDSEKPGLNTMLSLFRRGILAATLHLETSVLPGYKFLEHIYLFICLS